MEIKKILHSFLNCLVILILLMDILILADWFSMAQKYYIVKEWEVYEDRTINDIETTKYRIINVEKVEKIFLCL